MIALSGHCSAHLLAPGPKNGGRAVSVTRLTVLTMAASSLLLSPAIPQLLDTAVMAEPRSDFLF